MSFASELKDELCRRAPEEEPFLHALLYGFLLFFAEVFRGGDLLFRRARADGTPLCGMSGRSLRDFRQNQLL
jgi:hypothetical protein